MSWKTINHILGLAIVDQTFWCALQKDPLAAIQAQDIELTGEEQEILRQISAQTLSEFSHRLLDMLPPDPQS